MAKRIELEAAKVKITNKMIKTGRTATDIIGIFLVGLFDESEFEKKHFNTLKYEDYPTLEEIHNFFNGGE